MNFSILIVQIISIPKQCDKYEHIKLMEMKVQLPKLKQKNSFDQFKIYFWGDLGEKVIQHFRVGDFIIIEGLLSFEYNNFSNTIKKELKFTVFNICPFLLVDID